MNKVLTISVLILMFPVIMPAQTILSDIPSIGRGQIVNEDPTSRTILIGDNVYWVDSIYSAQQEYSEQGIISQRSFLLSDSNKYMLDSLIISNYDEYCLALDIATIFHFGENSTEYLIIECYNTFQYGSDSQPVFFVLDRIVNGFTLQSAYVMEEYNEKDYRDIRVANDNGCLKIYGRGISLRTNMK